MQDTQNVKVLIVELISRKVTFSFLNTTKNKSNTFFFSVYKNQLKIVTVENYIYILNVIICLFIKSSLKINVKNINECLNNSPYFASPAISTNESQKTLKNNQ